MSSFTLVNDLVFTGHRAFTSSDSAFYLYLDTGSENGKGFIWERGTGVKLSELDHEACVNSVVFHPQDEELCISVSDDKRIKVWNSLNRYKSSRVFDEAQLEVFLSEALDHKF
ncbi:Uncharacterized protein FKW44_021499 [Caligus rogercresseyi]|uniref:Uncharacterized protein n=1 Tax=Caligus rogercresseyi TaxID=217165 RepID=A0A7T8GRD7_CALRO|nr:Uncharacterized protein FKW44_021499 [Caligus rogercresseyi]